MVLSKKSVALLVFSGWVLLFPLFGVLWYFPIMTFTVRLAAWAVGIGILLGSLYFARKSKALLVTLAVIYATICLFVAISPAPGSVDVVALRSAYCDALESYEGCPYIWGGETFRSIDCSGLVRKALEDALTKRGIMTVNAGLIRSALWFYWHDTTARVIGQGYSGQTLIIANHLDNSLLPPGDMAIINSGGHVLAYLGDGIWIEADPGVGRVIKHPVTDNTTGMTIVRWKILSN